MAAVRYIQRAPRRCDVNVAWEILAGRPVGRVERVSSGESALRSASKRSVVIVESSSFATNNHAAALVEARCRGPARCA